MHPWIARNLIYLPILAFRGEPLARCLEEVRAFNALSPERMRQDQFRRLQSSAAYAYDQSPYYRAQFERVGLTPADIVTPEAFARLPLLAKADIQKHEADIRSREKQRVSHRHTSGSTGVPLQFYKDHESLAYMNAIMHDCYSWHGVAIGEPQARIWGIPHGLKAAFKVRARDLLLNRIRLSSFDIGDFSCREFHHKMRRFRPTHFYGVPSYMAETAFRLKRMNLPVADLGLKVAITTGEILYPEQKQLLEEFYNCPVANEYGTTECGIIAFACPKGGLHIMSHSIYLELVNPATGLPVKPGERGEVVITDLTSRAMPFLRYRLGDTAQAKPGSCACGLPLPLLGHIEGRLEDLVATPDGRKVAGGMFYYTLTREGIRRFKAYQRAINHVDVLIEKDAGFEKINMASIRQQWQEYLGEGMNVDFRVVDEIPPDPGGKFRFFVSQLPKNGA